MYGGMSFYESVMKKIKIITYLLASNTRIC